MKKQPHHKNRRRGPYKEARAIRSKRSIRFSEDEWDQVQTSAGELGTTPAAYVRKAALRPLSAPRIPSRRLEELIRQMIRVGVNLNQLARLAAQGRDLDSEALADALAAVNEAVSDLKNEGEDEA